MLAIENYYGKNNFGWNLYEKMQNKRCGNNYGEEAIVNFKKLIKNWEENDYDQKSCIEVNKNIKLLDGSHRLAMALYYKLKDISIRVYMDENNPEYNIEWFLENDFTKDEINCIVEKYNEIIDIYNNGIEISGILWSPAVNYFDEIIEKIKLLYHVKEVKDIEFSDETYARMVKAIYSIDDIDDWKVEKKIEYMNNFSPKKIRYFSIHIEKPKFRFKQANYNTILTQGEKLKQIIRNCYRDKIDNYFYDIIFHTSDNTKQCEYISKLVDFKINLSEYFDLISKFNWMIIKLETPNLTKDFPYTFPFSKDLDIICSPDCFDELKKVSLEYFKSKLGGYYEIKTRNDNGDNYKIRLELNKFLIYQIDINKMVENCETEFIKESLKNKIKINNYYVPKVEDELCYRILEYEKNQQKMHHLDYIKSHINHIDINLIKKYISNNVLNKYIEELN